MWGEAGGVRGIGDWKRVNLQDAAEEMESSDQQRVDVIGARVEERLGALVCFFFSSRRRHTRFDCDWSSDVCSSDLCPRERIGVLIAIVSGDQNVVGEQIATRQSSAKLPCEIGRASCRERV